MKICIIGAGYVGIIAGTCLASKGHDVTLIDIDEQKINMIKKGLCPIKEQGLEDLFKKYMPKVSSEFSAVKDSDLVFIAVGTPSKNDGSIDLSYIFSAAEGIKEFLSEKTVVVVKSTVIPGTTEKVSEILGKKACMNPEFLREGNAINDFLKPERIVLGVNDTEQEKILISLYKGFTENVVITNPRAAEMIKYTSNSFLAMKISFANEIANICDKSGINSRTVLNAAGLDSRISNKFLNPGVGFGGSCFPKDVSALINFAKQKDYVPELLNSVLSINKKQPLRVIEILKDKLKNLESKNIAVLGAAFKPGTDDIREAPALVLINSLLENKSKIKVYDPLAIENVKKVFGNKISYFDSVELAVKNCDACIIMTEWPEFKNLKEASFEKMNKKIIVDGRAVLPKLKDFDITTIGGVLS